MTVHRLTIALLLAGCGADDAPGARTPSDCRMTSQVAGDGSGTHWTYTPEGKPLTRGYDRDGDGSIDVLDTWTYDGSGLIRSRDGTYGIPGASFTAWPGAPESWRETYHYVDGRLARRELDRGPDGVVDQVVDVTVDDAGQVVEEVTHDPSGTVQLRTRYSYNRHGWRLTWHRQHPQSTTGYGGTVEELHSYTYDAAGRELSEEVCTTDSWLPTNLTFLSPIRTDYCAPLLERTSTYDSRGDLVLIEQFGKRRFHSDRITETRTHDALGNWLTRSIDEGADGSVETFLKATWDCPQAR